MNIEITQQSGDIRGLVLTRRLNTASLLLNGVEILQCDVVTGVVQLKILPPDIVAFVVYSPFDRTYILPGEYTIVPDSRHGADINFYVADTRKVISPKRMDECVPAVSLQLSE